MKSNPLLTLYSVVNNYANILLKMCENVRLDYSICIPFHLTTFTTRTHFPHNSTPLHQQSCYYLYQTIKHYPTLIILGTGILYNFLPEMDTNAARELSRWLTYHLVNTNMAWPYWEHWANDCQSGEIASTEGNCKLHRLSLIGTIFE